MLAVKSDCSIKKLERELSQMKTNENVFVEASKKKVEAHE